MAVQEKLIHTAVEYAKKIEPKLTTFKESAMRRFVALDRWSKLVIVTLVLSSLYCLLPKGAVPTMHLEFSTSDDLELLLAKLQPTKALSRVVLISKLPKLELQDPIRFNAQHSNRHFVFQHGAVNNPVSLHCAGSSSALSIRAHNVEVSNLIIEGCSRSAISVDVPLNITPSASGNTTTLSNVTLANNRADKGAAVYVSRGFLILSGVNATHNYASQGGAIYLAKGKTGLRVSPPTSRTFAVPNSFTRNSANKGGVVCAEGALLGVAIKKAAFESNQAFHAGGVLYSTQLGAADASIVNVDGCDFLGNQAAQVGGALACEGNHEVSVTSSLLKGNTAGVRGGALWLHSPFFGKLDVTSSTFKSNVAGCPVAAALTASDKAASAASTTRRRRAALRGNSQNATSSQQPSYMGAAAPTPAENEKPTDVKTSMGGAVFISGNFRVNIVKKSKLNSNTATDAGGAFSCIDCASLTVADTGFTANAAASGGAVYLQLLKGSSAISSSSFMGNRAVIADPKPSNGTTITTKAAVPHGVCGRSGGGAICLEAAQGATMKVSSSAFEENSAYSGGAMYTNLDACARKGDNCTVDVTASKFHGNTARFSGGALHFTDMAGVNLNCPHKMLTMVNSTHTAANATATNATQANSTATSIKKGQASKALKAASTKTAKAGKASKIKAAVKSAKQSKTAKHVKKAASKKASSIAAAAAAAASQVPAAVELAAPIPTLCSKHLKASHTTRPSRCSNTFTDNAVSTGYGPHVSSRVYCLEPSRTPVIHSPSASIAAPASNNTVRVHNDQVFAYTVAPFDFFLQHINVTVPDVSVASEPAQLSKVKVSSPMVPITDGEVKLPNVSIAGSIGKHSVFIQARLGGRVLASTPLTVDLRMCEVGEVTARRTCMSCDHDKGWTFSFDPTKTKCERCPWNAFCRGWSIVPRDGYWQAHPRSTQVHACRLPGACKFPGRVLALSGLQDGYQQMHNVPNKNVSEYQEALCTRGYEGPLCGACARGYGRVDEKCEKCRGRFLTLLSVMVWRLVEAAVVAALVSVRLFSGHEYTRKMQKMERAGVKADDKARASLLDGLLPSWEGGRLKWSGERPPTVEVVKERAAAALADGRPGAAAVAESLVLCWQLLRLLSSIPLALPTSIAAFLSIFTPSSLQVSLDCLLPVNSPYRALSRISTSATTPIFIAIFLLVAWTVFLRKRNVPASQLPPLLFEAGLLTAFEVSLFYYPQVISNLLSTFSCHSLASPLSIFFSRPFSPTSPSHPLLGYWAQDTSVTCYSPRHLSFALLTALPLLVAFAAIPPVAIYLFIRQHAETKALSQPKLYTRFGYLFSDYFPQYAYGHTLKFLFLLAASAIAQGPAFYFGSALQLAAFTALTGFASYWLLVEQPFSWSAMNLLAAASIAPATLTSGSALVMLFAPARGLLGWVAATLWLPALLVDGLVVGLLAGLLAVVVRPILPLAQIKDVSRKVQKYIRTHSWKPVIAQGKKE